MSHTNRPEKSSKSCNEDRMSALPDDVLHHVLGFLPAVEAVHTCLLAHRWHYLWKSIRRLRINEMGRMGRSTDVPLTKFVSCLMLLRDPGSTLDEVEIEYAHHFEDDRTWIPVWIGHALSCQAQVLTVKFPFQGYVTRSLDGPPLVSRYLRRLEISGVRLNSNFLNFSRCSTLEDLKIERCDLNTGSILSQSLKHMSIKHCNFQHDGRIHISVPNLVSLQLKSCGPRTPFLESMFSLEAAVVSSEIWSLDYCCKGNFAGECCGTCLDCCGNDGHKGGCVLLGGLSRAKNLELIAHPGMSLKHLSLTGSAFLPQAQGRICISVPNLVSLQLIKNQATTPLLESMPSLETAVVRSDYYTRDCCCNCVAGECCGICRDCRGNHAYNGICILLRGLSQARNLELIQADPLMFIFIRDIRWCPTFSKFKNLLLDDWCVQPDLRGLVSMLEHSPILENLTLQLCKQRKTTGASEVEENPGLMEKPAAISGYVKIIRIKCEEVDSRVSKVLKFLSSFGIKITVQRTNRYWEKMIQFQEAARNFGPLMDV